MRNVLVPFDGSPSAKRAIHYLLDAARDYPNLSVHLINVQSTPVLYGNYASMGIIEELNAGILEHARDVNREAETLLSDAGIRCKTHEVLGEVVSAVAAAVEQHGCDTVVMGTRGMSSLGNLLMGSVATRVVHGVSVPVLLVK